MLLSGTILICLRSSSHMVFPCRVVRTESVSPFDRYLSAGFLLTYESIYPTASLPRCIFLAVSLMNIGYL
jgi:hypothetical protein